MDWLGGVENALILPLASKEKEEEKKKRRSERDICSKEEMTL